MNMKQRFLRWRRYQRMVRDLGDYPHHELTELGIARADIGRIAWGAVLGEPSAH